MRNTTLGMIFAVAFGAFVLPAFIQSAEAAPLPMQAERPAVKARSLMTPAEQTAYKNELRQARTVQERQQIQEKKYAQLRQRAAQRGVTMIEPPAKRGNPGMRPESRNEKPPRPAAGR